MVDLWVKKMVEENFTVITQEIVASEAVTQVASVKAKDARIIFAEFFEDIALKVSQFG